MATTGTHADLDQLVRTLSHDMSANFMLLQNSFSHLKKSLQADVPRQELDERVAHVEACLQESKRFLDDLVWLGRTGAMEMEPDRVSVAMVVRRVLFEQRELLSEHDVQVDVRRSLPTVWCHEARLKQIVTNLIRNAVLHGCDRRRPRIVIARAEPGGRAMAGFRIHDNGLGIDRRFHGDVFRPGRRLVPQRNETSEIGGSGMGLAIVKRIVDHYKGSVYVDPECNVGTAIVVALPQADAVASLDDVPETTPAQGDGPNWKLDLDGRHKNQRHRNRAKRRRRRLSSARRPNKG